MQQIIQGRAKVSPTIIETGGFETPNKMPTGKTTGLAPKIPIGTPQTIPTGRTIIPSVQTESVKSNSVQITPSELDLNVDIKASYDLPTFLLANLQSVGISGDNDKSPDLSVMLEQNNIDIACLTETWLSESNKDRMYFENYVCFNRVRENVRKASGGVSILVKEGIPTITLNIKGRV